MATEFRDQLPPCRWEDPWRRQAGSGRGLRQRINEKLLQAIGVSRFDIELLLGEDIAQEITVARQGACTERLKSRMSSLGQPEDAPAVARYVKQDRE